LNKNVLSIAPYDTAGISGIAGDLKTFQQWKCYGAGVVTEVIAANTTGIQAFWPIPFEFIAQQLESLTADVDFHGVKIGALRTPASVKLIASLVDAYKFRTLLLDPSFRTKAGAELVPHDVVEPIREHLFPKTTLLVVNSSEAAMLTGLPVGDIPSMREAAIALSKMGPISVVVTGGHLEHTAADVVCEGAKVNVVDGPKLATRNMLGLGSVFSASLLAQIVKGTHTLEAVSNAKNFVCKAMNHPFTIGHGVGPLNLNVPI
jgi:hydroxymethylpyrimidine/phosphomethylpyrimidine kinase